MPSILDQAELRRTVELYHQNDQNVRKTAKAMGLHPSNVSRRLTAATRQGHAPGHFDNGVAPGNIMGKVTIARNKYGEIERTWERQHPDEWQHIEDLIMSRVDGVKPIDRIKAPKKFGPAQLLNQVTIADGHVGGYAWAPETGGPNWDLDIAHDQLLGGATWLMDNMPDAENLVFNVLGDFLDTDGYAPLTPASKHLLDVCGRFPQIADVGESVIEQAVMHALHRYKHVTVVIKPGNHDPLSAFWMRKLLTRIFKNEPRVTVDPSIRPYWAMLFGKTMICSHHGDKAKLEALPGIFAADFAEMWGQARYRICHTGHLHHKHTLLTQGKELRGMMVYQHPTLAKNNAWAADRAFNSAYELLGNTYHCGGAMPQTLHYSRELLGLAA
jgi:hypothetical protein